MLPRETFSFVFPRVLLSRFSTRRNFARGAEFFCLVISRVELIRKEKEKFHSARKIPPSGKQALGPFIRNKISRDLHKTRLI